MTTALQYPPTPQGAGEVPKRKPGRPKGERPGRTKRALYVEIDGELRDALDEAVISERRELNTVVSMALEAYLSGLGKWPRSVKEGGK